MEATHLKRNASLQGGKYTITGILGQGGFGITYLGLQVGLNRKVAIKEFFMKDYCNRDLDTSHVSVGSAGSRDLVDRFRQKFIKEVQSIAQLDHPNIVRIHDVFEENGTAYYVMEYVGGGSLQQYISSQGKLSEIESLHCIREIASALDYLHSRQMNHLDVKPGNVLRRDNGHVVLIDFGLSKRYDESGSQTSSTPVGVSAGYAPIEQYNQGGVSTFSAATDVYSLGATLYKMLTGDTPPNANQVFDEGLPSLPSAISFSVRRAVEQSMQPKRKDRPQSIDAFLCLLGDASSSSAAGGGASVVDDEETLVNGGGSVPPPPPVPAPSGKKSWLLPLLLVVVLLLGFGVWLGVRGGGEESPVPGVEMALEDSTQTTVVESVAEPPSSSVPVVDPEANYGKELNKGVLLYDKLQYADAKKHFNGMLGGYPSYTSDIKSWIKKCDSAIEQESALVAEAARKKKEEELQQQAAAEAARKKKEEEARLRGGISTSRMVDLGLSVKWAEYNVGASSPEEYGGLYGWGDPTGENRSTNLDDYPSANPPNNISGTRYDIARAKWGGSWRLPTVEEFKELDSKCQWVWTTYKGVKGYKVTGPNGNSIFFPAAGRRYGEDVFDRGSFGYYWSGSLGTSDSVYAINLYFSSDGRNPSNNHFRDFGRSVRPVSD